MTPPNDHLARNDLGRSRLPLRVYPTDIVLFTGECGALDEWYVVGDEDVVIPGHERGEEYVPNDVLCQGWGDSVRSSFDRPAPMSAP